MSSSDPAPAAPKHTSQRLHDVPTPEPHNDLDEPEDPFEAEAEHGRIGYGRFGEWTPYGLAALIILTIVIGAWFNQRDDSPETPPSLPDAVAHGAAPDFSIPLFNGDSFDLASHQGQVVVVNFWASWCEPCKKEMPAMQQLAVNNPDVVVLGVAASNDSRDKAQEFAENMGITYPLGIDSGGNGPNGQIASSYQVFGFPATFFINADGQIVDSIFGAVPLDDLQLYVDRAKST